MNNVSSNVLNLDDFNSYFLNIAQNLIDKIPASNLNPIDNLINLTVLEQFSIKEVSFVQVRDIIDN